VEFENEEFVACLPNYEDWAFVRIKFSKLNELSRLLVLRSFYELV